MAYDRQKLLDEITEVGRKYDGHITHGSAAKLADLFEIKIKAAREECAQIAFRWMGNTDVRIFQAQRIHQEICDLNER